MNLLEASEILASKLDVTREEFLRYCNLKPLPKLPHDTGTWSMMYVDASLVYACVRSLRPKVVLELGTHLGHSTRHILAALEANNLGTVVTVDNSQHDSHGQPRLPERSHRLIPLTSDGVRFAERLCFSVDLILEDADHTEDTTYNFLKNSLPWLSPGGLIMIHDICHPTYGHQVAAGAARALGSDVQTILVPPSTCGFGVWRKPLP